MKLNITHHLGLMLAFLMSWTFTFAQSPLDIANQHVRENHEAWGLTAQDVEDMVVNDQYTDKKTGISRVFFLQHHGDIPVYNAIMNYNITADGEVFFVGKRFEKKLASRVNTTIPILTADQAVKKLLTHLNLSVEDLRLIDQPVSNQFLFEKGSVARENILVKLMFQPHQEEVRLTWDILLAPTANNDKWSSRVDAVTGEVINEYNWTIYCNVNHQAFSRGAHDCTEHHHHETGDFMADVLAAGGGTYNVWPAPYESPAHGPRTLVEDPADEIASPYGWHDTDGMDGYEYDYTRGNNAHAYEDRDNSQTSSGNEPVGGADLVFDFDFDPEDEPEQYIDASVTNLFFWTNYMHDFSYHMGFDEAAGNFQQNTYGNGGAGGDAMIARAQADADGTGINNAFYSHSNDGVSGSINMFVWGADGSAEYLTVSEPGSVASTYPTILVTVGDWGAGAYVDDNPVFDAEVAIVDDGVSNPTDGCDPLVNVSDVEGKVALVDRGSCFFSTKAYTAEEAGAVGVIICDIPGATPLTGMSNGGGEDVNIPVVMISFEDCATIRQFAGTGLIVSLTDPSATQNGPDLLDGDLDNGIIAHEYGHGVSLRLTGGPSQACLSNAEQMGEGWSDWLSLVTTVQDGDTGDMARGIGAYAAREPIPAGGIRRYPYSTDMSINPLTYGDVASNTEVHALGEVWTVMVWDLYWEMVDKYEWSADPYDENSGNYRAMRLVYEGMKNQGCSPGFVTGRDAILAADNALYGGENYCDIYKVFARRGVGELADEGNTDSATDQIEDFTLPCQCRDAISIQKSVTDYIIPGEEITVTINVDNCRVAGASDVKVTDVIPDGTEYVAGSSNIPATVNGDNLNFELGDMAFGDSETIEYKLATPGDMGSVSLWLDDVEDDGADGNWEIDVLEGNTIWEISDNFGGNTGDWSWYANNPEIESQFVFFLTPDAAWEVTGDRPTLRFFHKYNTEGGLDGGFVEVKTIDESTWHTVNDDWYRNGYDLEFPYSTLALPFIGAFSGVEDDEWEASYLDLSNWIGETIQIRFHFAADEQIGVLNNGWKVDDIEFLDLLSYNTEACVTTAGGESDCFRPVEEGTIVASGFQSSATVRKLEDVTVTTFPNPANDMLNVNLNTERKMELTVSLLNVDGKEIMTRSTTANGNRHIMIDVSEMPAGFYFLKVSTDDGVVTSKVIIE